MIITLNNCITILQNGYQKTIARKDYPSILYYLRNRKKDSVIQEYIRNQELEKILSEEHLLDAMHNSMQSVPGALPVPTTMNLEVTNRCPLRCPQCYCDLQHGENLPFDTAVRFVREAASIGVIHVNISGGETLAYPYLTRLIKICHLSGLETAISISGWNFTSAWFDALLDAGLNAIHISLNGSTEQINAYSRDGYKHALTAIRILKNKTGMDKVINWVAHSNNIGDFKNIAGIAAENNFSAIEIIGLKPVSSTALSSYPSKVQMERFVQTVMQEKKIEICPENCFSSYFSLLQQPHFCAAGYSNFSISRHGSFTPCRHIEAEETFDSVMDYWKNSVLLKKIRDSRSHFSGKCQTCSRNHLCSPCAAAPYILEKKIIAEDPTCIGSLYGSTSVQERI